MDGMDILMTFLLVFRLLAGVRTQVAAGTVFPSESPTPETLLFVFVLRDALLVVGVTDADAVAIVD
jgi:hypothetical protein